MKNELGKVRQSAVVMNYGPGAIVDFRIPGTGAAVSVVTAGLEEWERQADEADCSVNDLRRMSEPRLKARLSAQNVEYFRLPPVASDIQSDGNNPEERVIPVVGVRFPGWLQCPECDLIRPVKEWGRVPGDPSRYCPACSDALPADQKVFVVPVRFILSCRNGHLDDFPWSEWVHERNSECKQRKEFRLSHEGAGLAGLVLTCSGCGASRSLEHIFRADAVRHLRCRGRRPWLADCDEECDQHPVVMQRGASNLYFPLTESALVIPPWSEAVVKAIGHDWSKLISLETRESRERYIEEFLWNWLDDRIKSMGLEAFKNLVEDKIREAGKSASGNLRWDEYQQFRVAVSRKARPGEEFAARREAIPPDVPHLSTLVRVVSLREIRVLKGFTRVEPLPGKPPVKAQFLSRSPRRWLPAIDVRGEGVFISLDPGLLRSWEEHPAVLERARMIQNPNDSAVLDPDNDGRELRPTVVARYLLIHSLAHILMKQLALQCGYSSASLRERLYVGEHPHDMAGVMIYTATSDSDGTLGGLQRQGESSRFGGLFREAVRSNEWCSSDPLCINGVVAATESSSLAACHSCLLAPETSCEDFNRFLDRAMLVGLPEDRPIGFFSGLD